MLPPSLTLRLTLALAGCAPAGSPAPDPVRCGPSVPETAQHPITVPPAALRGDYQLIQMQTQPTAEALAGRLHLAPLDSSARAGAAGGAVRDLIGWLEVAEGDPSWAGAVSSRSPDRPGVVLAGRRLRLGPPGQARNLEITAVGPEGFWGWWRADRGVALTESLDSRILPDPAGYFCALRLEP
jgi:hypothetical protein